MPTFNDPTLEEGDGRADCLARIRALPPLSDEQLDSLADLIAWIELDADQP